MEMVVLSLKKINCFAVVFDISFNDKNVGEETN